MRVFQNHQYLFKKIKFRASKIHQSDFCQFTTINPSDSSVLFARVLGQKNNFLVRRTNGPSIVLDSWVEIQQLMDTSYIKTDFVRDKALNWINRLSLIINVTEFKIARRCCSSEFKRYIQIHSVESFIITIPDCTTYSKSCFYVNIAVRVRRN